MDIIKNNKRVGIMNISCGTDIIEIDRIKEAIEKENNKFIEEIYTKEEIKYCESKKNAKYEHYAARFAAKEAVFKAISHELENKYQIEWKNIEIINDKNGRPEVNFVNIHINELEQIDLSISHCKKYAVANVVSVYN